MKLKWTEKIITQTVTTNITLNFSAFLLNVFFIPIVSEKLLKLLSTSVISLMIVALFLMRTR